MNTFNSNLGFVDNNLFITLDNQTIYTYNIDFNNESSLNNSALINFLNYDFSNLQYQFKKYIDFTKNSINFSMDEIYPYLLALKEDTDNIAPFLKLYNLNFLLPEINSAFINMHIKDLSSVNHNKPLKKEYYHIARPIIDTMNSLFIKTSICNSTPSNIRKHILQNNISNIKHILTDDIQRFLYVPTEPFWYYTSIQNKLRSYFTMLHMQMNLSRIKIPTYNFDDQFNLMTTEFIELSKNLIESDPNNNKYSSADIFLNDLNEAINNQFEEIEVFISHHCSMSFTQINSMVNSRQPVMIPFISLYDLLCFEFLIFSNYLNNIYRCRHCNKYIYFKNKKSIFCSDTCKAKNYNDKINTNTCEAEYEKIRKRMSNRTLRDPSYKKVFSNWQYYATKAKEDYLNNKITQNECLNILNSNGASDKFRSKDPLL